jgi:hypothetical protein
MAWGIVIGLAIGLPIGGFIGSQVMALYVAGKFWADEPKGKTWN